MSIKNNRVMKSRIIAALLAFFLGGIGINNFYTGHKKEGIIDIIFFWTGIPAIVNLVRAVMYIWCNTDEEFVKKYVKE